MVKTISTIVKEMTNAALDDHVKELWGEDAIIETDSPVEEDVVQMMARSVVKTFGLKAAAVLVSEPVQSKVKKWTTGEAAPNEWQLRFLKTVYEIVGMLSLKVGKDGVKWWFFARSDYLAGYAPADLLISDPMGVRMAAMEYLTQNG